MALLGVLIMGCGGGSARAPGDGGAGGAGAGGTGGASSGGDAGSLPAPTSVDLTSAVGGAQLPFTVGLGFRRGDVPSAFGVDLAGAQIEIKRRWNDGSVKHAVVSGHADLTAGQPRTIKVVAAAPGGGAAGKPLTCADILAAAPSASVTLGALGSVALAGLLVTPVRTWLTGPEVVECHYRGQVGADATLRVQFQVRLYRGGRLFVRVVVENGYLDVATVDKSYLPSVKLGDATIFDGGGTALNHARHTRWMAQGWLGGDPQLVPRHDIAALVGARLLPNYQVKPAAAAALDDLYLTYHPMEHGGWTPDMSDTGYQAQIGLLPNWDALYVTSNADPRAFAASLASAQALGSYPIVWRDSSDDSVVRPSARATWTVDGAAAGGETAVGAGGLTWDSAHHGSGGYLAYLLTGDFFYLETMALQSSLAYLIVSSSHGGGTQRLLTGQTRATAWANRTTGQYAALAPVDALSDDYRALLAQNAAHWKGVVQALAAGGKHLGLVYSYELAANDYGAGLLSPWQQNFLTQAFGHVSDLEPLADMTDWNAVRDYAYQFPVGLLGAGGADGYCFTQASQYTLRVADGAVTTLDATYASWGMVYAKMFNGAPCGNTLNGESGGAPDAAASGYWGNLMPAIAYAVDHHAPGAAAAWARFTGASNYSVVQASPFQSVAAWGVVPR
ncbi:MAG TPA: hypothetical protein VFH73_04875 [Polyangia bacterium]|nr:hypothetical protein [Polyangia bacterium]